jgi:hypothetical protein
LHRSSDDVDSAVSEWRVQDRVGPEALLVALRGSRALRHLFERRSFVAAKSSAGPPMVARGCLLNNQRSRPKINIPDSLDERFYDLHNSPPSLIAANENEAIKTNCSLKIYSR